MLSDESVLFVGEATARLGRDCNQLWICVLCRLHCRAGCVDGYVLNSLSLLRRLIFSFLMFSRALMNTELMYSWVKM